MEEKRKYAKLRGRIKEYFDTQKAFAEALGISEQVVIAKLAGRSQFSQADIIAWANALEITADDIGIYFFEQELSNR